jgi:membrane-bound metal-dependent hydrolase YbcI (DUF457 family)
MSIHLYVALIILPLFHYIADWRLQSRQMAEQKSSSNGMLGAHVYVYTVFCPFLFAIYLQYANLFDWQDVILYTLFNGLAHFITDWFTSRANARLWQLEDKKRFWNNIGLDQTIHFITLYSSLLLLIYVSSGKGR